MMPPAKKPKPHALPPAPPPPAPPLEKRPRISFVLGAPLFVLGLGMLTYEAFSNHETRDLVLWLGILLAILGAGILDFSSVKNATGIVGGLIPRLWGKK